MAGRRKLAEGLGIEMGVRPGGKGPGGRTAPDSSWASNVGEDLSEPLSTALPLPGVKLGMAVWLILGWLWKRTKMW